MKIAFQATIFVLILISLNSCIGDDFLEDARDPEVRITTIVDTLGVNASLQLEYMYLNNVGVEEFISVDWRTSDDDIAIINNQGLITGVSIGTVEVTAEVEIDEGLISDTISVIVGAETVTNSIELSGVIETTSSYKLTGDFTIAEQDQTNLLLSFDNEYCASAALPGLYIYLSNNPNSISDAFEIGEVDVFEGAHNYVINNVGIMDFSHIVYFCKPFNVKVGDGEIN